MLAGCEFLLFIILFLCDEKYNLMCMSGIILCGMTLVVVVLSMIFSLIKEKIDLRRAALKALGKHGLKVVASDESARVAYKGIVKLFQGNYPDAEELLMKSLSMASVRQNQLFCVEWLIKLYEETESEPRLLWAFRKAAEVAPDNPEIQSRLGHAYYADGKLENAEYCFEQALKYDPNHGYSYYSLSLIYMLRGEDDRALETLKKLEKEGFVKKTYGGAVLNKNSTIDMPLKIREKTNRKEKQKIAQTVASLIEDGESIMLDSSSTSLMIAQELKKKKKLTVITNSVEVLIELSGCEGIKVISTGGTLRDSSLSLVGKMAQDVLEKYYVDKAILSCKGIDLAKGVTDSHEMEADVKNCMHNCARTTILAADTSKLEHVFFVKVMDLSEGDILVLDKTPKKEWVDCLEKRGIRLITGAE